MFKFEVRDPSFKTPLRSNELRGAGNVYECAVLAVAFAKEGFEFRLP